MSRPATSQRLTLVSGGQTGVDREALDWALARGISTAGFLPADGLAEDGPVDARYGLEQLPQAGYRERTRANVALAEATLILSCEPALLGGSLLTLQYAREIGRPVLHLHPALPWYQQLEAANRVIGARVLNVAGPRASGGRLPVGFCAEVLDAWLAHHAGAPGDFPHSTMQPEVVRALTASMARFDALYAALAR